MFCRTGGVVQMLESVPLSHLRKLESIFKAGNLHTDSFLFSLWAERKANRFLPNLYPCKWTKLLLRLPNQQLYLFGCSHCSLNNFPPDLLKFPVGRVVIGPPTKHIYKCIVSLEQPIDEYIFAFNQKVECKKLLNTPNPPHPC